METTDSNNQPLSLIKGAPAPFRCPSCRKLLESALYDNGDSVDIETEEPEDRAFYLSMIYGTCPHCEKRFTEGKISQIAKPVDGYYFMDTGDHEYKQSSSYSATGLGQKWHLERCFDVTGISFVADNSDRNPQQFENDIPQPFLNVHYIDPIALFGYQNTFEGMRKVYRKLKPLLIAHDWASDV
tara:strand:+ start:13561 stop:14112 length:552 start_codon:yes stop_codon:yes gene_type:complete